MKVSLIPVHTDNYIFFLHSSSSNYAIVIDPTTSEDVLAHAKRHNIKITHILNTHYHQDHIGGNGDIKLSTNCKIIAPIYEKQKISADYYVKHKQKLLINEHLCEVIYVPGHTSGHVIYYFANNGTLFVGDTLFSCGCGRIFEGTYQEMYDSLQTIAALPHDTMIYCAHEYTSKNAKFALKLEPNNQLLHKYIKEINAKRQNNIPTIPTSLATQMAINPFLRPFSKEIRNNLNMQTANNLAVFTKIRNLRNNF